MARDSRTASSRRREHHRKGHRSTDSNGELLPRSRTSYHESPSPSPTKSKPKRTHKISRPVDSDVSKSTSNALSAGSLAQLDALNEKLGWSEYDGVRAKQQEERTFQDFEADRRRRERREERREERRQRRRDDDGVDHNHHRKRRVVSGPALERGSDYYEEKDVVYEQKLRQRGGALSDDYEEEARRRKRKRICMWQERFMALLRY